MEYPLGMKKREDRRGGTAMHFIMKIDLEVTKKTFVNFPPEWVLEAFQCSVSLISNFRADTCYKAAASSSGPFSCGNLGGPPSFWQH